jgi:hypothetical protein
VDTVGICVRKIWEDGQEGKSIIRSFRRYLLSGISYKHVVNKTECNRNFI